MIRTLELKNFRCFADHVIPLRPLSVIVGQNNAGKSTIVEALRLVSIVANRHRATNFSSVPEWLDIPRKKVGISPSLKGMQFNFDKTVFHRYGEPPALVKAVFDTGEVIEAYIGPDSKIHAVVSDSKGHAIGSKAEAAKTSIPPVAILPQVAPLQREEQPLEEGYVERAMSSSLASLHFRNELLLFPEECDRFRALASSTWPGLSVQKPVQESADAYLSLMVRDGDFVAEVAWMGHGLQMWLQTMWFLARTPSESVVILDEPDVYMHADLQRRLIRLVRGRYRQTIIATHSIEIMAEVEPEQILIVDRSRRESTFASSLPAVQRIVDKIGGVHNVQLARLYSSKKCLLVEGKDVAILKQFQNTLFPQSEEPLDAIPNWAVGGWSGWNYAVGSSMLLKNSGGTTIKVYCVLDHDYHSSDEIAERLKDAEKRGVQLYIWKRKEIENYLIVPSAIARLLASGVRPGKTPPTVKEVERRLLAITDDLKDECTDQIAHELFNRDRGTGLPHANQRARAMVQPAWASLDGRLSLVSGKEILKRVSEWSQNQFGMSVSALRLARTLRREELGREVTSVASAIEKGAVLLSSAKC